MGMKIDFLNHEITIGCQRIKLECSKSGRYVLPLLPLAHEDCNVIFHLESLNNLSKSEKDKKAVKLHCQFCHPSKERLLNLLKNANYTDKEFLNIIEPCTDSCKFCRKYKKAFSKPIVGFPIADKFNSVVCIDLKEVQKHKVWILHLIDTATDYSAACLISNKKKQTIVCQIFQIWIVYFGAPHNFIVIVEGSL